MTAFVNYDKIKGLVYTEKSNQQLVDSKYHFQVSSSCNKKEVFSLIKKVFQVDVASVNILNTRSKTKRFKGVEGVRSSFKKAIVTLKKGQTINFSS